MQLLKEKRKTFKSIHLTGGEPTLYPQFPMLVKEVKKLGYQIAVGTNGGKFEDKDFCRKTAPFIDEVCFSVHGHNEKLHNLHTNNRNSFKNVIKAIDNLSAFPLHFMSNTVITKHNIQYLKKILSFIVSKKIKQSLLSNLAPEGNGLKNYQKLSVRLKEIEKIVPGLAGFSEDNNMILRFFGIPACILGEYAELSNDFFWDSRLNIEQGRDKKRIFIKEEPVFSPDRSRIKTEKCCNCIYKDICGGIFQEYYRLFNDSELTKK